MRRPHPQDSFGRWSTDIGAFLREVDRTALSPAQAAVRPRRGGARAQSRWIEEATSSKFCALCGRSYILSIEDRAGYQSRGEKLPTLCLACRTVTP